MIENNTIYTNNNYGIFFDRVNYLTIFNNTIYNNVNAEIETEQGVWAGGRHINISNNTIYPQSKGILTSYQTDSRNNITSNFINCSVYNGEYAIYLQGPNNTISKNKIYGCSIAGIYLYNANASNNNFIGNKIKGCGYGIYPETNSKINYFYGTNFTDNTNDINQTGGEIYLINTTNYDKSTFSIIGGSTTVQWYAEIYVNDTFGANVSGANVSSWNVDDELSNWSLTKDSGYTATETLSEFMQNATSTYYYTNYSFNASKIAYSDDSDYVNLTENKIAEDNDEIVLTLTPEGQINISFVPPTPDNNTRQKDNTVTINVSVNGSFRIDSCNLAWDNGTGEINISMTRETAGTNVFCSKTESTTSGTTYWYRVYANDTKEELNVTDKRTFKENTEPPIVTLTVPSAEAHITDRTPSFDWDEVIDADGDSIQYVWNLTCYADAGGSCDPSDDRLVENITNLDYEPTEFLKNFWDTLEYYNWTVKAWDGYEFGPISLVSRFYIDSLVVVSMIDDTVNFGSIYSGQTNNSTDDNPTPFSLSNDGNCFINVSLNSTQLWDKTPNTNESYRYKFDEVESNSFNSSNSIITWTNVPIGITSYYVLNELNWSDSSDNAETDILITVPTDEMAGVKSSLMTFIGEFIDISE